MTSMVRHQRPLGMARWPNVHRVQLSTRSSRAAASSAGRIAAGAAAARASARPRTRGWRPSRSPARPRAAPAAGARCDRRRQRRLGHAHAPAVHAPPAHEQRARLPHEPHAERAALHHEPRARVQLARVVADEVAEQAERGRLAAAPARAPRLDHLRAAVGVQLRDRPRVREQDHADDRPSPGPAGRSMPAVRDHRRDLDDASSPSTPRAYSRSRAGVHRAAASGRPRLRKGRAHPPAIGRRRITSSASTGSVVTCSARPSPWLTTA